MTQLDSITQSQSVDVRTAMDLLSRGTMEQSHGLMPWSSNYTFLVTVRDTDMEALAYDSAR